MVDFVFEPQLLKLLVLLILVTLLSLHFLLFREYARQEKVQRKRLLDLEKIVQTEIKRSGDLLQNNLSLSELKIKTQEKLDLIKLQLGALHSHHKK
ncbi:hypothetical protein SAMN04488104_100519 [Algoriphagus faecimaris]|uniref:Uncharacterized protein n=1 Tax=Algoriphagus faecimaris TaxID=686796 RepID=A0A1G6P2P1_9BACT|nr:hypothetical protein [Algoriphagus faecimaris]SDC74329.1 hypothetical protein SAMN04488104_100519 [Algoriphagus faecimaris]